MSSAPSSKRPVVAIDGPAGAGKSSVARQVADALGFTLLDTGALYRAVALAARQQHIDWEDEAAVGALAEHIAAQDGLRLQPDASAVKGTRVWLLDEDVTGSIRTPAISMGASRVSAIPRVRQALLALQRNQANHGGVVAEGRDIGTVVFPDAAAKFFLTASLQVRAERRLLEHDAEPPTSLSTILAEVQQRDRQDSERSIAPLRQADDAVLVDSSSMPLDDVVVFIVERTRQALAEGDAAAD